MNEIVILYTSLFQTILDYYFGKKHTEFLSILVFEEETIATICIRIPCEKSSVVY